jgi:hypothetical protein
MNKQLVPFAALGIVLMSLVGCASDPQPVSSSTTTTSEESTSVQPAATTTTQTTVQQ